MREEEVRVKGGEAGTRTEVGQTIVAASGSSSSSEVSCRASSSSVPIGCLVALCPSLPWPRPPASHKGWARLHEAKRGVREEKSGGERESKKATGEDKLPLVHYAAVRVHR